MPTSNSHNPHDLAPRDVKPELGFHGALKRAIARGHFLQPFKANMEALLKEMRPELADEFLMIGQEGRGSFLTMLGLAGGRALFLGDALSGTVTALAHGGYVTTVCDHDEVRLDFARLRDAEFSPGMVRYRQTPQGGPFPFESGSFDLVVAELGPHGEVPLWGEHIHALYALTRDAFVRIADNSMAYKRALGRRGQFEITKPWDLVRNTLSPKSGEGRHAALKRDLARDFKMVKSFALYPHRLECSHLVELNGGLPRLTVGPKERTNRVKVLGHKLGLFPVFTPSFVFLGQQKSGLGKSRLERILQGLSEHIGEPLPVAEHIISTRGNVCVVQTMLEPDSNNSRGRWTLHIPFGNVKFRLSKSHFKGLQHVREFHPGVPVPEPLFMGELEGLWLICERRLPDRSGAHLVQGSPAQMRMLSEVSDSLLNLKFGEYQILTDELFDRLLGERVRRVSRLSGRKDTSIAIMDMLEEGRKSLLGWEFQPVFYHADLRPKHVQNTGEGRLHGILDWGAYEDFFLPYADLLHLFAHLRHSSARLQWHRLRDRQLSETEQNILDRYCQGMGIEPDKARAIERLYPLLVCGMAERNWEFSRPFWVHREFGL
ncbi:MAG: hypothetical protein GY930_18440 [bacterium]|nr:hypothetical protein [bacterium]